MVGTLTVRHGRRGVADAPRREPVRIVIEALSVEDELLHRLDRAAPAPALAAKRRSLELHVRDPPALVGLEVDHLVPLVADEDIDGDRRASVGDLALDDEPVVLAGHGHRVRCRAASQDRDEQARECKSRIQPTSHCRLVFPGVSGTDCTHRRDRHAPHDGPHPIRNSTEGPGGGCLAAHVMRSCRAGSTRGYDGLLGAGAPTLSDRFPARLSLPRPTHIDVAERSPRVAILRPADIVRSGE